MRHRDETCASHMPVLMELVEIARPKRVLEFGCGYYSTRLFVDACEEVVSVEEDDAWAEEMRALYGARPNWRLAPGRGLPIALGALRDFGKADLVLIDGDVYRAEETNAALESAPLVVGHDTQGWQHDAPGGLPPRSLPGPPWRRPGRFRAVSRVVPGLRGLLRPPVDDALRAGSGRGRALPRCGGAPLREVPIPVCSSTMSESGVWVHA